MSLLVLFCILAYVIALTVILLLFVGAHKLDQQSGLEEGNLFSRKNEFEED